jgi:acetyl-CoA synthetase
MYGTTEIGVILVSYPGADDFVVKPASLGKPIPGGRVEVHDAAGRRCRQASRELKVCARQWIATRISVAPTRALYHAGRAIDVIIRRLTMRAVEIEDAILKHPRSAKRPPSASDPLRAVVKAFVVVATLSGDEAFRREIQDLVRQRLSHHEYPRLVTFVPELPKTPAGKVNRKVLREREQAV